MSRRTGGPQHVAGLALAAAVAALLATAPPAAASCAVPAARSADAFTGVVTATSDGGRRATVRTNDGRTVQVDGAGEPGAVTSVDRTYVAGHRYRFEPTNGTSPYSDNACTATEDLGPASTTGARAPSSDRPLPAAAAAGAGLLAAAGLALAARRSRRRRPA